MNKGFWLIVGIIIFFIQFSHSQNSLYCEGTKNRYYLVIYGTKKYMELSNNKRTYQLKDCLPNGRWTVFYDNEMKDTAIVASVINGKVNCILYSWNREKTIKNEIEYKDGKKNGLYKSYFYENDTIYENISYYENDILTQTIKIEF